MITVGVQQLIRGERPQGSDVSPFHPPKQHNIKRQVYVLGVGWRRVNHQGNSFFKNTCSLHQPLSYGWSTLVSLKWLSSCVAVHGATHACLICSDVAVCATHLEHQMSMDLTHKTLSWSHRGGMFSPSPVQNDDYTEHSMIRLCLVWFPELKGDR